MLGLCFCVRAFSSCGKWGPLFIAVRGPLTIAASLVAEHRLQIHRLSNCGSRAQLLRSMWDLPRPGLNPVSPTLAGRFSTTAPPGKPLGNFFLIDDFYLHFLCPNLLENLDIRLPGYILYISYLFCLSFLNLWFTFRYMFPDFTFF